MLLYEKSMACFLFGSVGSVMNLIGHLPFRAASNYLANEVNILCQRSLYTLPTKSIYFANEVNILFRTYDPLQETWNSVLYTRTEYRRIPITSEPYSEFQIEAEIIAIGFGVRPLTYTFI